MPSGTVTLYDTADAARMLQVSTRTVWNLVHKGRIRAEKVGGSKWMFSESALAEYLQGKAAKRPKQVHRYHRDEEASEDGPFIRENEETLF